MRVFGFFAAAAALAALGQAASTSVSVSFVMPLDCVTLNRPPLNAAVCGLPPALGIEVSVTVPLRASTLEPTGIPRLRSRWGKLLAPGCLTLTVPLAGATTIV